ncbi:MAG: monooxygenase, partial [Pseudomonadota bacterium]|nr:monooxygenase [Pseudomonadota bacterium]
YDACGPGYTLLRFDEAADVTALVAAAQEKKMPLTLMEVKATSIPLAYRHRLLLCRSDQHVAWRGDAISADAAALVELLRGARKQSQ